MKTTMGRFNPTETEQMENEKIQLVCDIIDEVAHCIKQRIMDFAFDKLRTEVANNDDTLKLLDGIGSDMKVPPDKYSVTESDC